MLLTPAYISAPEPSYSELGGYNNFAPKTQPTLHFTNGHSEKIMQVVLDQAQQTYILHLQNGSKVHFSAEALVADGSVQHIKHAAKVEVPMPTSPINVKITASKEAGMVLPKVEHTKEFLESDLYDFFAGDDQKYADLNYDSGASVGIIDSLEKKNNQVTVKVKGGNSFTFMTWDDAKNSGLTNDGPVPPDSPKAVKNVAITSAVDFSTNTWCAFATGSYYGSLFYAVRKCVVEHLPTLPPPEFAPDTKGVFKPKAKGTTLHSKQMPFTDYGTTGWTIVEVQHWKQGPGDRYQMKYLKPGMSTEKTIHFFRVVNKDPVSVTFRYMHGNGSSASASALGNPEMWAKVDVGGSSPSAKGLQALRELIHADEGLAVADQFMTGLKLIKKKANAFALDGDAKITFLNTGAITASSIQVTPLDKFGQPVAGPTGEIQGDSVKVKKGQQIIVQITEDGQLILPKGSAYTII